MMNEMIIDNAAFCVEFSQAFLFFQVSKVSDLLPLNIREYFIFKTLWPKKLDEGQSPMIRRCHADRKMQ